MKTRNKTDKRSKAGQAEELRIMQLAAISTAAGQNTVSSTSNRITPKSPYYTAAYADVCRAVDREMVWRGKCLLAESLVTQYALALQKLIKLPEQKRTYYENLALVMLTKIQEALNSNNL